MNTTNNLFTELKSDIQDRYVNYILGIFDKEKSISDLDKIVKNQISNIKDLINDSALSSDDFFNKLFGEYKESFAFLLELQKNHNNNQLQHSIELIIINPKYRGLLINYHCVIREIKNKLKFYQKYLTEEQKNWLID